MPMREIRDKKTAAAEATAQIVTFQVGAESFGLDIANITEVIRPLPVTALPHMPAFVEGVINLRGTIIPVVDLRVRFGLAASRSTSRTTRMIIVRGAFSGTAARVKRPLGLVVDAVHDVLQVPLNRIGPAPEGATTARTEFIAGVAMAADRLIILIDIGKVLSGDERAALAEAGNVHP